MHKNTKRTYCIQYKNGFFMQNAQKNLFFITRNIDNNMPK